MLAGSPSSPTRTSARSPRRSAARTCTTCTYSSFRRRRFGAPAGDVAPARFVVLSCNRDRIGNRTFGDRLPLPARPLAAPLTCLAPFTPMLFQGEEYGEVAPFQFFTDHIDAEIAEATRAGRRLTARRGPYRNRRERRRRAVAAGRRAAADRGPDPGRCAGAARGAVI